MKKTIKLFLLYQFVLQTAFSQNVGIGTTTPQSKLDINGDIALRSSDITISTTYTYALNVNTVKQSNYKLKQPVLPIGNFVLAGIAAGVEGRLITLTNRTASSMEIYNEDVNATAANRIQTGTGNTVAIYPNGNVSLQYDATDQRWSIKSMHNNSLNYFGGGTGTSYWDLTGPDIHNRNTGNVGIGTNSPSFKLDITGNERINGSAITTPGFNGSLTSGGSLRIENTSNNFFLKADGGKIQAEKSNLLTTGTTASTLSINPHGGNVGIGIDGDIPYKLSIYQPIIESNSNTSVLQLRGQNPVMNFVDQYNTSRGYIKGVTNNSQTQYQSVGIAIGASDLNDGAGNFGDIYLLGKGYQPVITIKGTTNNVNIADGGGNVNIGGGGGTVNIGNTGKVNVGTGGMFAAQTGNLNLVPIGVFRINFLMTSDGLITQSLITNIAGTLATGAYQSHSVTDRFEIDLGLNSGILSQYVDFFVLEQRETEAFNTAIDYQVLEINGGYSANSLYINRSYIDLNNNLGLNLKSVFVIYGIK